jgi:hypothetical protein
LDREYLEDYEQKEMMEYKRFSKRIQNGKFDFEKLKFPSDERFINLQKPVSDTTHGGTDWESLWAQVPFCGSLILGISPVRRDTFEKYLFKISKIPEIIDFIKKTGRLQIALQWKPTDFEGLDFLDPIFAELKPPMLIGLPLTLYGTEKEIRLGHEAFSTLADIHFKNLVKRASYKSSTSQGYEFFMESLSKTYLFLRFNNYTLVEDVENLIVDDPVRALSLLLTCMNFICDPINNTRFDSLTFSIENLRQSKMLPHIYQPKDIQFPCEIGKFLTKKLTYAAQDMRACYDLMDNYDAYDLRRVQQALNEGIVSNHPDIVTKNTKEFSQILDNIWTDKTIPNRIKNIKIGIPVSIAAVGGIVAGLPGAFAGGFLSELGFKVVEKATEKYAEKLFSVKEEDLTERLAKLRTKSYQANIYDFKKKYKHKIAE